MVTCVSKKEIQTYRGKAYETELVTLLEDSEPGFIVTVTVHSNKDEYEVGKKYEVIIKG